jgi:serine/threonine protein kinase
MQIHDLSHNDIKPANILLDRQGHLKLADFGESDKLVDGKVPRTPHPGTCYYWAPEYTESNGTCSSERSNLWALALTLLETSIGKHPYPSDMSEFQRDSYIKTWTPKVPLDKISQESADFILHL